MSDISQEFRASLAMSHVSPFEVDRVLAGWTRLSGNTPFSESGFVVRMLGGQFCYIATSRSLDGVYTKTQTWRYQYEPLFLYDRSAPWTFNGDDLNADTHIAKQEAKYPNAPTNSYRYNPPTGTLVRSEAG